MISAKTHFIQASCHCGRKYSIQTLLLTSLRHEFARLTLRKSRLVVILNFRTRFRLFAEYWNPGSTNPAMDSLTQFKEEL